VFCFHVRRQKTFGFEKSFVQIQSLDRHFFHQRFTNLSLVFRLICVSYSLLFHKKEFVESFALERVAFFIVNC
jgi:hypothetical protein